MRPAEASHIPGWVASTQAGNEFVHVQAGQLGARLTAGKLAGAAGRPSPHGGRQITFNCHRTVKGRPAVLWIVDGAVQW
jgi:hypothetical protein